METIVYKSIQYIPLGMIGFGLSDFFIIHMTGLLVGHLNHANLGWDYGLLRYVFNNPRMHIWHHAKELPAKYGVNYGITLSIWDYLFRTAYVPSDGRDVELGFEGDDRYQAGFMRHIVEPFRKVRT